MRNTKVGIVGLIALVLTITGCQNEKITENTTQKTKETSQEAVALTIEGQKETYEFVDVEGNSYEAELLEQVPKHSYDFSRLTEENGFKYYLDEEGNIISKLGIDVSEYQPEVDWKQIKEAGAEFAIIRLGYRGYGEAGRLVEDKMFQEHIENAQKAGLEVGVYFFSQAITEEEVKEEAAFGLERIKDYEITCPVVFDTEEIKYDTARTDNLTPEEFTNNCKIFCDEIEEAGYDTMIYSNMKWLAFTLNAEELTDYDKWYADYAPLPQCPYDFEMWQYTETGKISGIDGNVDLNVWFPEEAE